jgi:ring-1,2-phenylacetyl-CoA epoxidase subunit PaaC
MSTPDKGPAEPSAPDLGAFDPNTGDDNPYDLLAEDHDAGHRWAYGTGFTDSLDGVDTSVPDGIDPGALVRFCLALADDALIYSHRLQQWVTRLPELEEETAVANIALDLLGQARMLLARAGGIVGQTEDQLAFFRAEREFRNVHLAEHADRDFAELVVRLLLFSTWRLALFEQLANPEPSSATRSSGPVSSGSVSSGPVSSGPVSSGPVSSGSVSSGPGDPVLAAIAAKGVNELAYHRDYAASWVVRLGDGTALSHAKAQAALDTLWPLTRELFRPDPDALATVDPATFDAVLDIVLPAAGLDRPDAPPPAPVSGRTGRDGVHTEAMGYILAELQSVARAHPDATW